jgi:CMP/dCMP kinase
VLVTISGPPGAGTTTASRLVAGALGIDRVPGGEVFRAMADEHCMTLAQFGLHAQGHPEVDIELDRRLLERARTGHCVIESRLAGWIVTNAGLAAVRCWIDCDERIRASRVAEREGITQDRALAESRARADLERSRYLTTYGIDLDDRSLYDLELDSGVLGPDELAARIIEQARSRFGQDLSP